MATRCPSSTYLGVARLDNYTWIINDRGYANVVEATSKTPQSLKTTEGKTNKAETDYTNVVFGLVYALTPADEARLDKNEGVPVAYTKEHLPCAFWPSSDPSSRPPAPVDPSTPPARTLPMLVYIDRLRTAPDVPRDEYVVRMNRGIEDALKCGVPEAYVNDVMRPFIPALTGELDGAWRERLSVAEEKAIRQAMRFEDESGVFGSGASEK